MPQLYHHRFKFVSHIFLSSKMENRGCARARAQGSFRFTRVLASCQKAMCDSLNLAPPSVRLWVRVRRPANLLLAAARRGKSAQFLDVARVLGGSESCDCHHIGAGSQDENVENMGLQWVLGYILRRKPPTPEGPGPPTGKSTGTQWL